MRFPPVVAFLAGFILLLAAITVRVLNTVHALKPLEVEHPGFYGWVSSPVVLNGTILVAVVLMAAGIGRIVLLHRKRSPAGPVRNN